MKRVLNIKCKDGDLQVQIKVKVTADGSDYRSDEAGVKIHDLFDSLVRWIHNQFDYDEIKVR